jgi:hypothetical protein
MIAMEGHHGAHANFAGTSAWLLQAKDFLIEARRLKPGPARNELREVARVLREIAELEAEFASGSGRAKTS